MINPSSSSSLSCWQYLPGNIRHLNRQLAETNFNTGQYPDQNNRSVRLDRALLPKMLERKSGVIIHISSTSGQFPIWESTMAYSAAKSALNSYSKSLSDEAGPRGIRVVTVSPGLNRTEAMSAFLNDLAKQAGITFEEMTQNLFDRVGGVPLGRMADPEETAELVHFFRKGWITVQNPHRFIHELIGIGGFAKTLTTRE
jgi:NAD(P)-dependent dehydrogenase (short-subunit alcohol dehydrogenase family)